MARKQDVFTAVVVTANDLRSGVVVFRRADGDWTHDIDAAAIADDPGTAQELLARALVDQRDCRVVEPVLVEIVRAGGQVRPASLRERIRASGPTVEPPSSAALA